MRYKSLRIHINIYIYEKITDPSIYHLQYSSDALFPPRISLRGVTMAEESHVPYVLTLPPWLIKLSFQFCCSSSCTLRPSLSFTIVPSFTTPSRILSRCANYLSVFTLYPLDHTHTHTHQLPSHPVNTSQTLFFPSHFNKPYTSSFYRTIFRLLSY